MSVLSLDFICNYRASCRNPRKLAMEYTNSVIRCSLRESREDDSLMMAETVSLNV
jgi:hypothetical protein